MFHLLKKFQRSEEGSIVEYIILLSVIAVVVAFLFPGLRGGLENVASGVSGVPAKSEYVYNLVVKGEDFKNPIDAKDVDFGYNGKVEIITKDGRKETTNGITNNYKFMKVDQKNYLNEFIQNGRIGTLTKMPTENKGIIVVIGWNKLEYHFASKVTTYDVGTEITLGNGFIIETNDYIDTYEFRSNKERDEIITKITKAMDEKLNPPSDKE